jgi:hypothetical protein
MRARSWLVGIAVVVSTFAIYPGPVAARVCESWGAPPPTATGGSNTLTDVTAPSTCSAWAVGSAFDTGSGYFETWILRWNGRSWKTIPSPNVASFDNFLYGVTAASPTNVWAVGYTDSIATQRATLTLHYDGQSWTIVDSPVPGGICADLTDVDATMKDKIFAVGERCTVSGTAPMILRWNGSEWKTRQVPALADPNGYLSGVDVVSDSEGWAVGGSGVGSISLRLTANGWVEKPTPDNGIYSILRAVTIPTSGRAFAVGTDSDNQTLAVRWNGSTWKEQVVPAFGDGGNLWGVVGTSMTNAWAVGDTFSGTDYTTLILHWNGSTWARRPTPNFDLTSPMSNRLIGVARIPKGGGLWAVGSYSASPALPLILRGS